MAELKKKYTIAIVTHNLQQAKRVADFKNLDEPRFSQGDASCSAT
jgi:ABC-type phosphate transport system ATPase subunit